MYAKRHLREEPNNFLLLATAEITYIIEILYFFKMNISNAAQIIKETYYAIDTINTILIGICIVQV